MMSRLSEMIQGHLCPGAHPAPTWQRGAPSIPQNQEAREDTEPPPTPTLLWPTQASLWSQRPTNLSLHKHSDPCSNTGVHPKTNTEPHEPSNPYTLKLTHAEVARPSSFLPPTPTPNIQLLGAAGPPVPGRCLPPSYGGAGHCPPGSSTISSGSSRVCLLG